MGGALKERTGRADESSQLTGEPLGMTTPAETADNFIAEMAQFVQHYLLGAMAVAFGGGVLVGWLIMPNSKIQLHMGSKQRQQKVSEDKADKRAISRWEGEGGALSSSRKGSMK